MTTIDTSKIVKDIGRKLFEPEERRLKECIDGIIVANMAANCSTIDAFIHRGERYSHSKCRFIYPYNQYKPLHFSIIKKMDAYLVDKDTIDNDKKIIEQILFKLLYNCKDLQEIRDTLPATLVSLFPTLSQLHPRYSEGYLAPKDPLFVRQYEKVLKRIEYYVAVSLIY